MSFEEEENLDSLHYDEPTEDQDPTDPVDTADAEDSTNPRQSGEEPVDPVDPSDPIDPEDPIDPIDPVDPEDLPLASGIETYLSKFDIEAGMIDIEGENIHFNDLDAETQVNVLESLQDKAADIKGEDYGLNPDETGLLNYMRSKEGMSVDDVIEEMAQTKLDEMRAVEGATGVNYTDMDKDAIFVKDFKMANPEASEDEAASELAIAKESKYYDSNVEGKRKSFIANQATEKATADADHRETLAAGLEEDRAVIVEAVSGIDTVMGFETTDTDKNEVLGKLLEIGDSGDSLFMEEVFSDPETLFKVATMYYQGEKNINALETYYKRKITEAKVSSAANVLKGAPGEPITRRSVKPGSDTPPAPARAEAEITIDDLHAD